MENNPFHITELISHEIIFLLPCKNFVTFFQKVLSDKLYTKQSNYDWRAKWNYKIELLKLNLRICKKFRGSPHILLTKPSCVVTASRNVNEFKLVGEGRCCSNQPIFQIIYKHIPRKWLVCNACLELKQFGECIEKKVRMGDIDERM